MKFLEFARRSTIAFHDRKFCTSQVFSNVNHKVHLLSLDACMRFPWFNKGIMGSHYSKDVRCLAVDVMSDVLEHMKCLQSLGVSHGSISPISIKEFMRGRLYGVLTFPNHSSENLGCQPARDHIYGKEQSAEQDMLDFGRTSRYVLSGGHDPYGERDPFGVKPNVNAWRTRSFLVMHEANDLLALLLHEDPTKRLTAEMALRHPLFWTNHFKFLFLRDVAERYAHEFSKDKKIFRSKEYKTMQDTILNNKPWNTKIDPSLISHMRSKSKSFYKYDRIADLIRFIRNIDAHYNELGNYKGLLGNKRADVYYYFALRFPMLFITMYNYINMYFSHDPMLKEYFP